jgi:hypothetical protein
VSLVNALTVYLHDRGSERVDACWREIPLFVSCASSITKNAPLSRIPSHVKGRLLKMSTMQRHPRDGMMRAGTHHVSVTDKTPRTSNSSSRSKKSPGAQVRVIRTTNGTGVEEYDDLDGPSLLKKTLGLQNKHHSQYVGATRGLEPILLGHLPNGVKSEVQLSDGTLRRVSSTEAFLLLPDPGTQGFYDELADLDAIEAIVRPHGRALVDMYFRIVFPSFPIIHKEVYLEKYSRSYREFSPP